MSTARAGAPSAGMLLRLPDRTAVVLAKGPAKPAGRRLWLAGEDAFDAWVASAIRHRAADGQRLWLIAGRLTRGTGTGGARVDGAISASLQATDDAKTLAGQLDGTVATALLRLVLDKAVPRFGAGAFTGLVTALANHPSIATLTWTRRTAVTPELQAVEVDRGLPDTTYRVTMVPAEEAPTTVDATASEAPDSGGWLMVPAAWPEPGGAVLLLSAHGLARLVPTSAASVETGVGAFAKRAGSLGAAATLRRREALGSALAAMPVDDKAVRAFGALQLKEGLMAHTGRDDDLEVVLQVDAPVPCGDDGVFLTGYLADPHGHITRIAARTPYGERLELTDAIVRVPAPSREEPDRERYAVYVPAERGARAIAQVRLYAELDGGLGMHAVSPVGRADDRTARAAVLDALPPEALTPGRIAQAIHPAVSRLQTRIMASKRITAQHTFGPRPAKPPVSLVIPLYRQYGFLRHQAQAFARDPDLAEAEIVYVLDRPEDAETVERTLTDCHRIFGVAMRLIVCGANYGFAGACNLGALLAKGRHLVFLNSDVVPQTPGWLSAWRNAHLEAGDTVGVSGVRLHFPDGSLQHAGLYHERGLMPWWTNHHRAKGLPPDTPGAQDVAWIAAVTGAAAMIQRKLFRRLGGFHEGYIIGDFEDSDLCMAAVAAGYRNLYVGSVALEHIERASVRHNTAYWGTAAARYNGWLHTRRWDKQIAELAEAASGHAPIEPRSQAGQPETETQRVRAAS